MCADSIPSFLSLFDPSIAPPLLFYSYLPAIILSLVLGVYVMCKNNFALVSKLLFAVNISFAIWVLNILVQWIAVYHNVLMFSWQLTAMFESLLFLFSVYFFYIFMDKEKRDIPSYLKIILMFLYLPMPLLLGSKWNIGSYDPTNCEGIVGPLWTYLYYFEPLVIIWITSLCLRRYLKAPDSGAKKNILFSGISVIAFLFLFWSSNYLGELTKSYQINFFGAMGMMIFLGLMAYIIVRFKAFNLKLIGSNVLVLALWVFTGSLLLIDNIKVLHLIVAITLALTVILGIFLIRGVRREVKQREEIEKLLKALEKSNDKLWVANEKLKELDKQKTEFVSMASHQLRSPLTSIKGYSSMLLEGSFGELGEKAKGAVEVVFQSSQKLVRVIEDFLNITRIELGTMKYDQTELNFKELVETVAKELKVTVEKKGLQFSFDADPAGDYQLIGDAGKLSQVVSNLIDNAIKYTPGGWIKVILNRVADKIRLTVSDSGVGMPKEVIPTLFQKFIRADDTGKINITGTGLGLYVARQIIEAHHGKIWAESDGLGKGSRFIVEL
ncbi:MAG: HAMP domain-containing sensor histidine kinase [Patescibacteria group bacterium]